MALYLDPISHPNAYNTVVFANTYRTPGKCLVSGFSRDNEYDIKTGKGTAGATETLKGQPPAKGSITFWAWTEEQRRAWTPIIQRLTYKPAKNGTVASPASAAKGTSAGFSDGGTQGADSSGSPIPAPGNTSGKAAKTDAKDKSTDPPALTKADAIEIFYPTLADIGVTYVLPPEKIGIWEPVGDDYTYTQRKIDFVEFTQPPAANIATTPTGAADGSNEPGVQAAGGATPPAPTGASAQAKGAGKDAQGAWGGP
jgi:hypothetical protein